MKINNSSALISGSALALAVMGANIVNLFFNVYLGRVISIEEFGVLALINTFIYFGSLLYGTLGGITNREVAFLDGETSQKGTLFFLSLTKQLLIVNSILAIVWFLLVPYASQFFHLTNQTIFYLFTPLIILYPLAFLGRGYLQGRFLFILVGLSIFIEPVIKLISAYFLLSLDLHHLVYISIYISAILSGIITFAIAWKKKIPVLQKVSSPFPFTFFGATLLAGLSTLSFLAIDMIMVKHFLSPDQAGQYAMLALLGKIVYFAGSLLNIFTISVISRDLQNKKNSYVSFYQILLGSAVLAAGGVFVFGVLGSIFIPLIFTQKADSIVQYALPYLVSMALFTLGNTIIGYHLALKQYYFSIISLVMSVILIGGIILYHTTITDIVYTLLIVSIFYSLILILAHIRQNFFAPPVALSSLEKISEEVI